VIDSLATGRKSNLDSALGRGARLVVEDVRVTGWQVEIRLRVPLDGFGNGGKVLRGRSASKPR